MTSFRSSAFFVVASLSLAMVPAFGLPVAAAGPPANSTANPPPPAAIGQAAPAKAAGESPAVQGSTAPIPESVQSQPLAIPEGQLVGLIDSSNGGFRRELWSGSERIIIETLLLRLPTVQGSPAMTDLERRLLLTRADPPQGPAHGSLLAPRLDHALAIGQVGAVEALAQQVQPEILRPEVLASRVDALFYQAKDQEGCALAEKARGRSSDVSWAKRLAFCDALAGKAAPARMAIDVLGESGDQDRAFTTLMGKLLDKGKPASVSPDNPSAVHFALLRQTGSAITDATLERASPGFLVAWSSIEKVPLAQRIAAAERAASSGALPAPVLLKLYHSMPIKPQRLAAKYNTKVLLSGADGAAYAVQRLGVSTDDVERAHLIAAALKSARDRSVYAGVAAVLRNDIAGLTPRDGMLEVAPALGSAEAMTGSGSAKRWLDLMRVGSTSGTEAGAALRSLLAVRGFGGDVAWTGDQMLARLRSAKPADQVRAGLEWSLLRPFGMQQSTAIFLARLDGPLSVNGVTPSLAVLEGLQEASDNGRIGETAIYALLALGPGPRTAHPLAIAAAVRALLRVGLESDARAIAAESLAWRMP